MPSQHNLLLEGGAVAHNCSHAVCYSVISYASAWLKYHYPLEWWCAVLQNASKNETNEKFWVHCSHWVDLPDVNLSGDNYQIVGDRIRAPIGLLHGVGAAAHQEICENRPYTSIDDFCQKIQNTKKIKGRSSLHSGVVCSLIASGSMDSLFPPGTPMEVQMESYRVAMVAAGGDRKMKIDPIYLQVNPFVKYQIRKEILAAYSAPLIDTLLASKIPGVKPSTRKNIPAEYTYQYSGKTATVPFVDYEAFLDVLPNLPFHDTIRIAVVAYVLDGRKFSFNKDGMRKEAIDLCVEIGDKRYNFVRWPNKFGKLPEQFNQKLPGSIVILVLEQYNATKPFSILDMTVVQKPFEKIKKVESPKKGKK